MRAVDLFAGWGGFTIGAEAAGVRVVWAANHWQLAVDAHRANHPHVHHECQDLRQADWTRLPLYDLLIASPACQGHSEASQPKRREYHDAMRATAWAVIDCAEATLPKGIVVENVPAFARWQLFDLWCEALKRLGYAIDVRILRASHHGVPQRRNRLFVFGTRHGRHVNIVERGAEPPFGPCIDWSAPGWRHISLASSDARDRMAKARARLGPRFLSQHVTGHPGVGLDEPIRTITTKDQWIVVDGNRYRSLNIHEIRRAMAFPESYRTPVGATRAEQFRGFGNAVPPPLAEDAVAALAEAA